MDVFPKVAILVLNYNGASCLAPCLRSLQSLQYPSFQVVVIDNGSTDASFAEAQKNFPSFIYIKKEKNTGFAAGMNTGISYAEEAGFDFVWLMNYDATVYPDTLTKLMEAAENNHSVRAFSPVIQNQSGSIWYAGGHINYLRMRTEHWQKVFHQDPYPTFFLTGCAPLLQLSLLQEIGSFDERFFLYYEDADLSARIIKSGQEIFIVPEARVIHEEKSSSNPKKLYYLVHYGLLFFALHTPKHLRLYMAAYVTIRRLVNQIKLILGLPGASMAASAYADYFRKFQAGNQLYLRKLS